ncbi:hypothetical protein [Subtercola lobariae]|uniref:SbsA Ig-like domain-containing protein n=1 Tax=Subtercola lobariae TaxID=1588641 RepID=A0A917EWT3_9MICO|nr:hypothetical protein [Subtercola lobariae]GGF23279.1 hypothetical protein GCM10011399_16110 [Subtercola lobariae]
MSIEAPPRPPELVTRNGGSGRERSGRRFRRLLYGSIAVFSLLVVALIGANLTQGPQLKSAQINLNTSVERAGQRLLLQTNEPLAGVAASHITITPSAGFTASVNASSIDIQFSDILQYDTAYTVTVSDVQSISAGASSTLAYTFTTPDPTVNYLAPAADSDGTQTQDAIMSVPLSGGPAVTVYSAPHIRRFVAFATALVVNTVNDDGTDALTIVSLTGAADIPVQVAGPGIVTSLKASLSSNLFGYTFSANPSAQYPTPPDLLYAYDLTRGQDYTIPITGTDHEQLSTQNWAFVPNSTSLVAQAADHTLLLIDTVGERDGTSGATVVTTADSLNGFIPGTKTLISTSNGSYTQTDFSKVGTPSTAFTVNSEPARAPIFDSTNSVITINNPTDTPDPATVTRTTGQTTATLFTATSTMGAITAACLSPNGKYIAVTTESQQISYLNIANTNTVSTNNGQQPGWCSSN